MASTSASSQPSTLYQLCKDFGLTLRNLQICCIWCKNHLTSAEAYAYHFKDLHVVWKKGFPYAACAFCLEFYSKVCALRHYDRSAFWHTVEQETGLLLEEQIIRCAICQKPLSPSEKDHHIYNGRHFRFILNRWTGRCTQCRE
ncbi:early protein [human papillomavirus 32]|uniref:Protein E6 n=1 Tax=Human papillomavirus type 32 TaxID=333763 RepID=VE6_HPV32|nr:early protein [Human papillomavirus type 32]P36810.1 RecName: Full=Protein E6 [Human papillomavirus type 32]CAA52549.1 early protein [Human papillomavirus type 32]